MQSYVNHESYIEYYSQQNLCLFFKPRFILEVIFVQP